MKNHTDAETQTFALLGHPIGHSLSPVLQNTLASQMGVNMIYTAFDVPPEQIEEAVKGANALGVQGMNITVPYKEEVFAMLDDVDETAKSIGAVNTLIRKKDGSGYRGANTDMTGLKRAMEQDGVSLKGKDVIVLGAGGAARSVCMLLALEGASHIYLLNRTKKHAVALAKTIKDATGFDRITVMSIKDYKEIPQKEEKYYCAQCTNVGMYPNVDETLIEDGAFYDQIAAAFDLIYRPEETRFLRLAREHGAQTSNGLKMLLYQGVEAFERWFDVEVPAEAAKATYDAMYRRLTRRQTIALVGFMGAGKSTISRLLADRLDEQLLDSDTEIEKRVNTTISDIFAVRGEGAFRAIETRILREIANEEREPFVLSTGGGVPLKEENREALHQMGAVIYLKTSPEEIYRRVKGDNKRPLLQTEDPRQTIVELEEAREEYYQLAADITITTDHKTPDEIADEILELLAAREPD